MRSLKKKDIAFFDIGLDGSLTEQNRLGTVALSGLSLSRYSLRARTGQSSDSSSFPVRSVKLRISKNLGREAKILSFLALKEGKNDKTAFPCRNPTDEERAWISLTLLAEAKERRNKVFLVRLRREASSRGSKGDNERKRRTTSRFQARGLGEDLRS